MWFTISISGRLNGKRYGVKGAKGHDCPKELLFKRYVASTEKRPIPLVASRLLPRAVVVFSIACSHLLHRALPFSPLRLFRRPLLLLLHLGRKLKTIYHRIEELISVISSTIAASASSRLFLQPLCHTPQINWRKHLRVGTSYKYHNTFTV
ncbi:hypothetical protein LXL04_002655 [Taraxacum kok-saghyz]